MPEMTPEEMAAMQEQAGKSPDGQVTKLVQQVGDGLSKLSELLNGSQSATDADRQQMATIMNSYIDLVEKKLGSSAPGEDAAEEEIPADQGAIPMQGGRSGQPMGPQSRM